jgi:hypothetical protein
MFRFSRIICRQYVTNDFTKIIIPTTDPLFWGLINFRKIICIFPEDDSTEPKHAVIKRTSFNKG